MSQLNKAMKERERAERKRKRKQKKAKKENSRIPSSLPTYGADGSTISSVEKTKKNRRYTIILIVVLLFIFIYLPQFFMKDHKEDVTFVKLSSSAIKKSSDYLKNHPKDDFDGDGIINSDETQKKTDPWNIDTDGDCVTDYCELNVTRTDPTSYDSDLIVNTQKKLDQVKAKDYGTPYKIGNVIMWANDYVSKSMGSVVETPTGYRFCSFNGYAQFPSEDGNYAYRYKNGVHELLPYAKKENAWRIHPGDEVEITKKPLQEVVEYSLFGHKIYGASNEFSNLVATIIPDKGLFAASKKMKVDTEPDTGGEVVTDEIKTPILKDNSDFRFGKNNNNLKDLQYVRTSIEQGVDVAVSIFDQQEGEFIGIVYGYDKYGNLLIANKNTLKPMGKLIIKEAAYKMMQGEDDIVSVSWFEFGGLYYKTTSGQVRELSSYNNDHISFFAASAGTGDSNLLLKQHLADIQNKDEEESTAEESTAKDYSTISAEQKAAEASTDYEYTDDTTSSEETTTVEQAQPYDATSTDGETGPADEASTEGAEETSTEEAAENSTEASTQASTTKKKETTKKK